MRCVTMTPKDGKTPTVKWRPEFLALAGVDGDPWRALILSQFTWWAALNGPRKWLHKTAEELLDDVGARGTLSERTMRRKLLQLEEAGLLIAEDGWQRRKRFRVVVADTTHDGTDYEANDAVADAYEQNREASWVVAAKGSAVPNRSRMTERPNPAPEAAEAEEDDPIRPDLADPFGQTVQPFGQIWPTQVQRDNQENNNIIKERSDWKGFDDWLVKSFSRHHDENGKPYRIAIGVSASLAMSLSGLGDRSLVERYVLATLVNLDGKPKNFVQRAMQKRQRFDKFMESEAAAVPIAQGARVLTAADAEEQRRKLDEIFGANDD